MIAQPTPSLGKTERISFGHGGRPDAYDSRPLNNITEEEAMFRIQKRLLRRVSAAVSLAGAALLMTPGEAFAQCWDRPDGSINCCVWHLEHPGITCCDWAADGSFESCETQH